MYELNGAACKDSWKKILVAFNGNKEDIEINLPEGNWSLVLSDGNFFNQGQVLNKRAVVSPRSALILAVKD